MADKNSYNVIIVIVNYRAGELVVNCLESLKNILNQSIKAVVVDNSSGDNSVTLIGDWISNNENAYLICSENNSGFSGGNNLAIESVKKMGFVADFIWLLNPDTVVRENALQHLLTFMEQNPQVGIAGSRLEDIDGRSQCSAFRFHSVFSELDNGLRLGFISRLLYRWRVSLPIPDVSVGVDWVAGASMLIRKQVFEDAGLFDDKYFLYFEETDFCLQAKRKGWECWYVPKSRVVHLVGQSTGVISGNINRSRRPKYWFESRQYYFLKNHGLIYTMLADLIWGIGFAVWRLRRLIQGKPDRDPERMLLDFWKNSIYSKLLTGKFINERFQ